MVLHGYTMAKSKRLSCSIMIKNSQANIVAITHSIQLIQVCQAIQVLVYKYQFTKICLQTSVYQHLSPNISLPKFVYKHQFTNICLQTSVYQNLSTNISLPTFVYKNQFTNISLQTSVYQHLFTNISLQL